MKAVVKIRSQKWSVPVTVGKEMEWQSTGKEKKQTKNPLFRGSWGKEKVVSEVSSK